MINARPLLASALLIGTAIPVGIAVDPRPAQQVAQEQQDILPLPTDPKVLSGKLSNGLRFAILPVPPAEDGETTVAFLLQIGAGSAYEEEDQIGAARLAAELVSTGAYASDRGAFEKSIIGLDLDQRDAVRASTGYTATRFTIAVPVEGDAGLSSADISRALELLGSMIAGEDVGIDEQEITQARAELLARQTGWSGPSQRITARALPELFGDSVYGRRVPIYDRETLQNTDASAVDAFIESWYTPRHATLVVVGPVDRAVVQRMIEKSLGPLAPGPASEGPNLSVPTPEKGRAIVESDAGIASDVVQLMLIQDPAPPMRCAATLRNRLAEQVATQAMSRRLEELARSSGAATLQGGAFSNADAGGYRMSMLNVAGSPGEWERLTREAVASLNSAQELGFTQREIDAARERVRQEIESQASSWERRSSASKAADIASKVQRGDAISDPQEYRRVALTSLAFLDPADITRATKRTFPIDSMSVLVVSAEESASSEAVTRQVLTGRAIDTREVAKASPLPPEVPLFDPIDGEGAVIAMAHDPEIGVTTATLKGGVVLHHKPMDPGRGRVIVTAGLALSTMTDDPVVRAELSAIGALGWQPAIASHPSSRLSPALDRRDIEIAYKAHPDGIVIEITTPSEHLEFAMQALRALLDAPRVEPGAIDRWRVSALQADATARTEPAQAALRVFERHVAPEFGSRSGGLDADAIERVTVASVQARLDSILRESPVRVAIAGDVDRARALQVGAALLSDRASQNAKDRAPQTETCTVNHEGPTEVRLQQALASHSAAVVIGFLGPDSIDVDDAAALDVIAVILEARLRDRFRQTTVPGAAIGVWSIEGEAVPGSGRFWARAIVGPGYADAAAQVIREELNTLHGGELTDEEFRRASTALVGDEKQRTTSASAWAGALVRDAALSGEPVGALLSRAAAAKRLTPESVRAALEKYDTPERSFRIIVLPSESGRVD